MSAFCFLICVLLPRESVRNVCITGAQNVHAILLFSRCICPLLVVDVPFFCLLPRQMASAITNQGQWYRLLTPVVLHGSVPHLVVNSLSLNSVGPVVRRMACRQGPMGCWYTPMYTKHKLGSAHTSAVLMYEVV